MRLNPILFFPLLLWSYAVTAQDKINISASIDIATKTIDINERIVYKNNSNDTLTTIYLNDWNNAYATKNTPLAKRFTEEFNDKFHFAKSKQRGYTVITGITDHLEQPLTYSNLKEFPDVVEVQLQAPLLPQQSYDIISCLSMMLNVPMNL